MKKYIPVFGPQELFDGAENCDEYLVAVQHSVGQKTKVSFYQSLVEAFNYATDFPPRGVVFHRAAMRRIIKMPVQHSDDIAVDLFATKMKEKLEKSRDNGRTGWESCPIEHLISGLKNHIEKGDPVDVANFAMMISQRDESIKTPVWTVADKKAGRLPEIGMRHESNSLDGEFICRFVDVEGNVWSSMEGGRLHPFEDFDIKPIETPAEKAQRLRDEWAENANEAIFKRCSSTTLNEYLRAIHDAILSGELKAPEVE